MLIFGCFRQRVDRRLLGRQIVGAVFHRVARRIGFSRHRRPQPGRFRRFPFGCFGVGQQLGNFLRLPDEGHGGIGRGLGTLVFRQPAPELARVRQQLQDTDIRPHDRLCVG